MRPLCDMKWISVRVLPSLWMRLRTYAAKRGSTLEGVMVHAANLYLKEYENYGKVASDAAE